jgi:hypothetical protein
VTIKPFETSKQSVILRKRASATASVGTQAGKPAIVVNGNRPAVPSGSGKLNVAASSGWCTLSVDGVPKGPTPIAGLELSAGSHQLSCVTEDGKPHTATVTVKADDIARYRFAL